MNPTVKINAAVRMSMLNQYLGKENKGFAVAEPSIFFGYVPSAYVEITSRYLYSRNSIGAFQYD
jgi:hypothetical protein